MGTYMHRSCAHVQVTMVRHFESILTDHSTVAEEALAGLVDYSQMDELRRCDEGRSREGSGYKLQNGKSAGDDRIGPELLKDGGEAMTNCQVSGRVPH